MTLGIPRHHALHRTKHNKSEWLTHACDRVCDRNVTTRHSSMLECHTRVSINGSIQSTSTICNTFSDYYVQVQAKVIEICTCRSWRRHCRVNVKLCNNYLTFVLNRTRVGNRFQEAQLLQRNRAMFRVIKYFTKLLKITQDHSKWLRVCVYKGPFIATQLNSTELNRTQLDSVNKSWLSL